MDNIISSPQDQDKLQRIICNELEKTFAFASTLALLAHTREKLAETRLLLAALCQGKMVATSSPSLGEIFCMAAGEAISQGLVMTQNGMCNRVAQFLRIHTRETTIPSIEIIRTVTLPVYCRLIRDGQSESIALPQTLLHILAWNGKDHWIRDQAQRLLWKGGVLGDKGLSELHILDMKLASCHFALKDIEDIIFITGVLSHFPQGDFF